MGAIATRTDGPTTVARVRVNPSAAFLIPALFVVETVLGGPFGSYGGIPVRYALFGTSIAALGMLVFMRATVRKADVPAVAVLLGLLAWQAVWATLIPAAHTTDVALAWTEFRPVLVLLAPSLALIACISTTQLARVVATMRVLIVRSATVLAVVQIVIWVIGSIYRQFQAATALLLARAFPGTADFLYVGPMPDGFFRVFWVNSIWLPVAFFLVPLVVRRVSMAAGIRAVLLAGLFVTYSRGIWLGTLVGGVVAFAAAFDRRHVVRQLGRVAAGLAAAGVVGAVALTATGQVDRTVQRFASAAPTTGTAEPDERVLQIAPLVRVWETAPLVGVGSAATRATTSERRPLRFRTRTPPMPCSRNLASSG